MVVARAPRAGALALLGALLALAAPAFAQQATLPATASPRASLALNTSLLAAAGDWLTVSWTITPVGDATDFVALLPAAATLPNGFAPPDGARTWPTSPVKLRPTYGAASGTASFRLPNLRVPHRWYLFRGGLASPRALGQSDVLAWREPNEPTGAHLAMTGTASEMRVLWTTLNEQQPRVFWGPTSGAYANSAPASGAVLLRSELCGDAHVDWKPTRPNELTSNATGMGWLSPGLQHAAVMTGLTPGERVFYAMGNASGPVGGAEWSFLVPPPSNASASVRFLVAADMGVAELDGSNWDFSGLVVPQVELSMRGFDNRPAANTTARLLQEVDAGAQLLLLNGDISYARGFAAIWESFMDAMQPVAARVPVHTVPGNHESCWPGSGSAWNTSSLDSGGECLRVYSRRFVMPAPASLTSPWYSVDVGPVHFTHISTEHALDAASPQLAWLRADLDKAKAAGARWRVLSAHRFFYIDSSQPGRDAESGRALLSGGLEALMLEYGVDVTLTGHHHSYQRSCPVRYGTCVPLRDDGSAAAPVHIVAGNAGAGLAGVSRTVPIITHISLEHGYLSCTANATHLLISSRRSDDGTSMDEVVLVKPQH